MTKRGRSIKLPDVPGEARVLRGAFPPQGMNPFGVTHGDFSDSLWA